MLSRKEEEKEFDPAGDGLPESIAKSGARLSWQPGRPCRVVPRRNENAK
jgi:hypothetical protein